MATISIGSLITLKHVATLESSVITLLQACGRQKLRFIPDFRATDKSNYNIIYQWDGTSNV